MKTNNIYSKLHRLTAALAVIVIVIVAFLQGSFAPLSSYAATDSYTDVLTDLQKDESFNMLDYPSSSIDYSLEVIQIAESEDGELFIYVYQPYTGSAYDLTATSINISTTIGEDNLSYKNYSLTLLSQSDTLYKYIVNNFAVKSATVRYYDISSIYRTYYTAIDGDETGDNTTSELAIAVAQCWAVGEVNGETYYDMQETEVVTVTAYAGFVRYSTGTPFSFVVVSSNYVDSHFIAFSCDYDIEELYEADISFVTQSYTYTYIYNTYGSNTSSTSYGDKDYTYYDEPLTVDNGESVSYENIGTLGVFGKSTYSWERICTLDEFLENLESNDNVEYDSDFIDNISGSQWVLRFYESEYTVQTSVTDYSTIRTTTSTIVSDVTILRLKFLCDGQVYNLGVVSNKITGSEDPDVTVGYQTNTGCDDYTSLIRQLLMIAALVLLCVLFAPLLPYVAKFIVWVISLPFKLINAFVHAVKKHSDKPKKE